MSKSVANPFRLLYHPASSASMRVTLYLSCRGVDPGTVTLVSTGAGTDHRGILVFTMPEGEPETEAVGTSDLTAFNPEGRIPVLIMPDGRTMTQTGPIIDYLEDCICAGTIKATGPDLYPDTPWERAEVKRIMWIIAADTQPYQNIPFIIQAITEWGMTRAAPTEHPLCLHFIRREFGAIEHLLHACAGAFAVGDNVTVADCFLVPQIRNALLAGINLDQEFPRLAAVWNNCLSTPEIRSVVDQAGGPVQPYAFDSEKFEVYVTVK